MIYEFEFLNIFFIIFWFLLFIFSLFLELRYKYLSLLNFSFAALVAGISGIIFAEIPHQIAIFVSLSLAFLILLYPYYRKNKIQRIFDNQICTFIGREAIVSKTITPNEIGEIKFYDITWKAVCAGSYCLEEGELVLITGKSGVKLVASKINS